MSTGQSSAWLLDAFVRAYPAQQDQLSPEVLDRTASGRIVVLEEFLARPELDDLVGWVLSREAEFDASRVISLAGPGRQSPTHRRSTVLYTPGPFRAIFEQRLMSVLDHVRMRLDSPRIPVREIEMQITGSNDGDYFHAHDDNGHQSVANRKLTYVYFFHREPIPFSGGRLRIYGDSRSESSVIEVEPAQNQIVFFLPHLPHEIEMVHCSSRRFADSRFTVNGWYKT